MYFPSLIFLVVFSVISTQEYGLINLSRSDKAAILETLTLTSDGIRFPHCTLSKEFLSTASSVYGCQRVVEQNPICNRSLVVAYSQLEPLVYQNESGHVVGILPGKIVPINSCLVFFCLFFWVQKGVFS